jgi:hypothetical protein
MAYLGGSDQSCEWILVDGAHYFRIFSKSGQHASESMDGLFQNRWTTWPGICGRFAPDYALIPAEFKILLSAK